MAQIVEPVQNQPKPRRIALVLNHEEPAIPGDVVVRDRDRAQPASGASDYSGEANGLRQTRAAATSTRIEAKKRLRGSPQPSTFNRVRETRYAGKCTR